MHSAGSTINSDNQIILFYGQILAVNFPVITHEYLHHHLISWNYFTTANIDQQILTVSDPI